MHQLSPAESVHALDLDALRRPEITFWTIWSQDAATLMGSGALKSHGDGHGEIKSMRTAEVHRGKGVGQAMLGHILAEARKRSYTRLSLETGSVPGFEPALRLYTRFGFTHCGPFADYAEDPLQCLHDDGTCSPGRLSFTPPSAENSLGCAAGLSHVIGKRLYLRLTQALFIGRHLPDPILQCSSHTLGIWFQLIEDGANNPLGTRVFKRVAYSASRNCLRREQFFPQIQFDLPVHGKRRCAPHGASQHKSPSCNMHHPATVTVTAWSDQLVLL
jgi:putative acetyltransferase